MKKIIFLSPLLIISLFSNEEPLEKPENPLISFYDKVHIYGDLRLRHQEVKRDDKENSYEQRYRARLGLTYEISDKFTFEGQISSGKDNPTSGNVSMDDGIDFDKFKIDVLDIKYDTSYAGWIRAGKSKHYFYRSIKTQLVWDNDLRPEGVSYGFKNDKHLFTSAIWKVHRINGELPNDNIYMFVAQYTNIQKFSNSSIHLGLGFYHYDGVRGSTSPYKKGPLGNTTEDSVYQNNYAIAEAFIEYETTVFNKVFKLAMTTAYNTAVSSTNKAYDISTQYGKIKRDFDWRLRYTYRYLEKDSVFAAHNDSDFISGGTDGRGHIITAKMQIQKHIDIAGHFQYAKKHIYEPYEESDYDRLMLDLIFKF